MPKRPRRSLAVALVSALACGPPSASERPAGGAVLGSTGSTPGATLRFSPPVLLGSGVEVTLQNGSNITLHANETNLGFFYSFNDSHLFGQ